MVALHKSVTWYSFFIVLIFILPTFTNNVSANAGWKEDGWLNNQWTEMRLDNGDEFGCHGMPNMDVSKDTEGVAIACRSYLTSMTNASRWSKSPVSFGVDVELSYDKHNQLDEQGFTVHGVDTGLENTSWHNGSDVPMNKDDWWNLGQLGSIESGASKLSDIQDLSLEGGLVNLYWEARIADLKLRTNKDLIEWLEFDNNSWMTTWGEAWSYWSHRESKFNLDQIDNETWDFTFSSDAPPEVWEIPITRGYFIGNANVTSVEIDGEYHSESRINDRKLNTGWRQENNLLYLTISNGENAIINFNTTTLVSESSPCSINNSNKFGNCSSIEKPIWYNNLSWAFTITGHHTSNLFDWSNKFDESKLVFTWLVLPEPVDEYTILLPLLGVSVAVATIWYARKIITEDKINREKIYSEE